MRYFRNLGWALLPVAWLLCGRAAAQYLDYSAGVVAYNQTNWDVAITNFSKSIDAGYNVYASYCDRAFAEASIGQSNAAMADCEQAINLSQAAYFWRSRVELKLNNLPAAVTDYETGMRIWPQGRPAGLGFDLASGYGHRSLECFRIGDMGAAMDYCKAALSLDPQNANIHAWHAWLNELHGAHGKAIAEAGYAIDRDYKNAPAHLVRAYARAESNDTSGALEDCDDVLGYSQKLSPAAAAKLAMDGAFGGNLSAAKGLKAFLNGQNQDAIQLWNQALAEYQQPLLKEQDNPSKELETYFGAWIKKAQDAMTTPGIVTTNAVDSAKGSMGSTNQPAGEPKESVNESTSANTNSPAPHLGQ